MGESDTKISSHDINVNWKYQLFPKKNLKKKKKKYNFKNVHNYWISSLLLF